MEAKLQERDGRKKRLANYKYEEGGDLSGVVMLEVGGGRVAGYRE